MVSVLHNSLFPVQKFYLWAIGMDDFFCKSTKIKKVTGYRQSFTFPWYVNPTWVAFLYSLTACSHLVLEQQSKKDTCKQFLVRTSPKMPSNHLKYYLVISQPATRMTLTAHRCWYCIFNVTSSVCEKHGTQCLTLANETREC